MVTGADLLGHVGYVLLLIGTVLISRRRPAGWLFRFAGESVWVGIGFELGLTSVYLWGIAFVALDFRGWLAWRRGPMPGHGPA